MASESLCDVALTWTIPEVSALNTLYIKLNLGTISEVIYVVQ